MATAVLQKQEAGNLISKAGQNAIGPWFWGTIWIPLTSYLWTFAWIVSAYRNKRASLKIKLFSKWHVVTMIILDFFWFFAVILLISLLTMMVCHGTGIGGGTAWAARLAVKIGTFGGVNFDFCNQVPQVNF